MMSFMKLSLPLFPFRGGLFAFCLAAFVALSGLAQSDKAGKPTEKPAPDLADLKYGPHQRNVLDLWKARSDKPTPLVVFIHGGGFHGGSKDLLSAKLLDLLLKSGISVMAINYRLSPEIQFPAHYMDCARAIQFARFNAKEWNIDPKRVATTGGSAGAGMSLWIGFHDDMADPKSNDPVLRQSTRLTCIAVVGAQSSYDPRVIKEWVGEAAAKHPALEGFFGVTQETLNTPEAFKRYEAASAINYLTKDDPPVYAFYSEPRGPLPTDAKPGQGIHHINFGLKLKEKMDKLGIECIVRHKDQTQSVDNEMRDFLVRHLLHDANGSSGQ
jgi:acetyl esterase/lipase